MTELDQEYIKKFVEQSNALDGYSRVYDIQSRLAFSYLMDKPDLTEISVTRAWEILASQGAEVGTRNSDRKGLPPWELVDFSLAGWCMYAREHATTQLKAAKLCRIFLLVAPFKEDNALLARLLFLWITLKNGLPKTFFKATSKTSWDKVMDIGSKPLTQENLNKFCYAY